LDNPTSCRSGVAGDFDNDMDLDLYLVCSHWGIKGEGKEENLANIFYENIGDAKFIKIPNAGGAKGTNLGDGQSVTVADYDNDGFLDLFITNGNEIPGPNQLFQNNGNSNHWIEIDLIGTSSNRDGIGSFVIITSGNVTQIREQSGGMHTYSQNHQRIHFGLGNNTMVDSILVNWPSGNIDEIKNISADQILQIIES